MGCRPFKDSLPVVKNIFKLPHLLELQGMPKWEEKPVKYMKTLLKSVNFEILKIHNFFKFFEFQKGALNVFNSLDDFKKFVRFQII